MGDTANKPIKVTVTIEVPAYELERLSEEQLAFLKNQRLVNYLLADALYEFISHRGGGHAEEYVSKRYDYMSAEKQAEKVKEVNVRKAVAEALRNGDCELKLE